MAEVADAYLKALGAVEQTFAEAVGPRWARLPEVSQRQLFADTWRAWAAGPGSAAGLVRVATRTSRARRGEPRRQETVVELLTTNADALTSSFRPAAQRAAAQIDWPAVEDALLFEDEEPAPEPSGSDLLDRAIVGSPRGLAADVADAGPLPDARVTDDSLDVERLLAQLRARLAELARHEDPKQRALGLLVQLHMSEPVIVGAPRALFPPTRYSRRDQVFYVQRDRRTGRPYEGAFGNLLRYHALDRARQTSSTPCPSCRLLARFLRAPGLTPAEVTRLVNDFLLNAL